MPKSLSKNLLIFLLLSSIFALAFAYISQYFFDYQPCILCLHQRKPFFAIIAISSFALIFKKHHQVAIYLCVLALIINIAIAFYHVGVEQKIFAGPDVCSSDSLNEIKDLEKLKMALLETKAVRCDEPQFFFLGLSMAVWNLIFCLGLAFLSWYFRIKKSANLI